MTVGIYIRVSSEEQVRDGYSLTAQKERLTAFCVAQGWESYKFYVEEGLSAKNAKRPVYQNLMNDIKEGKVNTVLVYKLDRIMRSIGDLDRMLKTMEEHDCGFKSATEPFDTTNATGKLFMYIVGAFAQWEIDVNSERISMVLEEKVANEGVWIGNVPYPFDKNPETQKLVPNEKRAKTTLKMIDLLKKGYSSTRIADYLTEHNNDKEIWHHNTVLRILRNPALCGDTSWNDKVYKNTHKGIISRDEFEYIQEVLDDRTKTRLRYIKRPSIFQGKLACPSCDEIMSHNRYVRKRKDGSKSEGALFRCHKCAKENKFNKSPSEANALSGLYEYMGNVKFEKAENIEPTSEKDNILKELEVLERKRARYQRAWANEFMTDEEFQERMQETKKPYEELKEKLGNYKELKPVDVDKINDVILMFNSNFKLLTQKEKREFVSTFIKKIRFEIICQKPVRPDRHKVGRYKVKITDVVFY